MIGAETEFPVKMSMWNLLWQKVGLIFHVFFFFFFSLSNHFMAPNSETIEVLTSFIKLLDVIASTHCCV